MDFPDDDREFNITFDKKDNEIEFARDVLEKKVDSLGWKVTFMAIIIPCLIGVVVVLSYFSITKKVTDFQNTGSATVHEFSSGYEAKLADMQKQMAAREEAIEKKLALVNQNAAAIKNDQKSIKSNQSGIKENQADIKSLTGVDNKLSASLKRMQKDMEKLTEAVGDSSRQMLALRQKVEAVDSRLAGLSDTIAKKPDMETVSRMLDELETALRPAINTSASLLQTRLRSLEGRISDIERQMSPSSPGSGTSSPPSGSSQIIEEELK